MLEEADWEDDVGDDGGFQRELQLQSQHPCPRLSSSTLLRFL